MQVNPFYPLQNVLPTCSMQACVTLMVTCISWRAEVTEGAQQCVCGWAGILNPVHPPTHSKRNKSSPVTAPFYENKSSLAFPIAMETQDLSK